MSPTVVSLSALFPALSSGFLNAAPVRFQSAVHVLGSRTLAGAATDYFLLASPGCHHVPLALVFLRFPSFPYQRFNGFDLRRVARVTFFSYSAHLLLEFLQPAFLSHSLAPLRFSFFLGWTSFKHPEPGLHLLDILLCGRNDTLPASLVFIREPFGQTAGVIKSISIVCIIHKRMPVPSLHQLHLRSGSDNFGSGVFVVRAQIKAIFAIIPEGSRFPVKL
mmetsp:Transcript_13675/g.19731  ORF Transcript_13675/g.19731 Transcript_13675/m.19731 type:complete len:220 (-) Transcript_13675:1104-1763(-)